MLKYLDCSDNYLTGIFDVSNLVNLEYLNCANNRLTGLRIDSRKLIELNCSNNDIRNQSEFLSNLNLSLNLKLVLDERSKFLLIRHATAEDEEEFNKKGEINYVTLLRRWSKSSISKPMPAIKSASASLFSPNTWLPEEKTSFITNIAQQFNQLPSWVRVPIWVLVIVALAVISFLLLGLAWMVVRKSWGWMKAATLYLWSWMKFFGGKKESGPKGKYVIVRDEKGRIDKWEKLKK